MSELTLAERWKTNRLPNKTFTITRVSQESGHYSPGDFAYNVRVNGVSLPSVLNVWDAVSTDDLIHLPEENADWLPFFSGPAVANSIINDIPHIVLDTLGHIKDINSYGLIFLPLNNAVAVYVESDRQGYSAIVGDFSMTARSLHSAIKSLVPTKLSRCSRVHPYVSIPEAVGLPDDTRGSWNNQGLEPTSSLYAYTVAKKFYENLYGHQLSDIPTCHLAK